LFHEQLHHRGDCGSSQAVYALSVLARNYPM
jgi:hypothetical protein